MTDLVFSGSSVFLVLPRVLVCARSFPTRFGSLHAVSLRFPFYKGIDALNVFALLRNRNRQPCYIHHWLVAA